MSNEEQIKEVYDRNAEALKHSKIFLSLYDDGCPKDPLVAMQIGLAVMLDKPICLVVPYNAKVPDHLLKIATNVQYHDGTADGIHEATLRLLKKTGLGGNDGDRADS